MNTQFLSFVSEPSYMPTAPSNVDSLDFTAGNFAAKNGDPFVESNSHSWMIGYMVAHIRILQEENARLEELSDDLDRELSYAQNEIYELGQD